MSGGARSGSSRGGRCSVAALGLALGPALGLAGAGCRDDSASEPIREPPTALATTGGEETGSTGEPFVPGEEATDACIRAPTIGAGRHEGTLQSKTSSLGGPCGEGGPDAFFRLEVPRRSDVWLQGFGASYSPRVGVLPHSCVDDWSARTLACTEGVGTWLLDVPAGSSLVVSVGIDPEDPLVGAPVPMSAPDPFSFVLDVGLRNVLEVGVACEPPGRGRCVSGTSCLPPPDGSGEGTGVAVCTELFADTCGSAERLTLGLGANVVPIDPSAPQTDAHVHSCGGGRTRERVIRLQLPPMGPYDVRVQADAPEVGLALRAPGCGPADERDCAAPSESGTSLAAVAETDAFLFVELPPRPSDDEGTGTGGTGGEPTGEEAPISLEIEVLPPMLAR